MFGWHSRQKCQPGIRKGKQGLWIGTIKDDKASQKASCFVVNQNGSRPVIENNTLVKASFEAPVVFSFREGANLFFASGDGKVHRVEANTMMYSVSVHSPLLLCAVWDDKNKRLVTGGADGRLCATDANGNTQDIACHKGQWINTVTVSPWGALAYGVGKDVVCLLPGGGRHVYDSGSPASALAFSPQGRKLAFAHYNGVSIADLAFPHRAPEVLSWKGSHIGVTWSSNSRFLVSSLSEKALHIWALAADEHGQMGGYAAKPAQFLWVEGGQWLTTTGAGVLVFWPFKGKKGPIGQEATVQKLLLHQANGSLVPHNRLVTALALHSDGKSVITGHDDGSVLMARRESERAQLLHSANNPPSAVTHLMPIAQTQTVVICYDNGHIHEVIV
jgi:WD40 repeat protein